DKTIRLIRFPAEKINALAYPEAGQGESGVRDAFEITEDGLFLKIEGPGLHSVVEKKGETLQSRILAPVELLADLVEERFAHECLHRVGAAFELQLVTAGPTEGQTAAQRLVEKMVGVT